MRNWDVDLLQALFKPEEVQLIRGISLSDASACDRMKLWKIIWNLSVPPKVRNFMWRVAKNAIPVKTNLVKLHMLQEANCDHCQSHSEDVLHVLWLCRCLTEVCEFGIGWSFRDTDRWVDLQKLILHVEEAGLDLELFSMIV
nr:hypothetical protein CFP56_00008 [Quercus suber]